MASSRLISRDMAIVSYITPVSLDRIPLINLPPYKKAARCLPNGWTGAAALASTAPLQTQQTVRQIIRPFTGIASIAAEKLL